MFTVGINIAQDDGADVVGYGNTSMYGPLGDEIALCKDNMEVTASSFKLLHHYFF